MSPGSPLPALHSFAVVPAAGLSARMGRPKLLLDWQGRALIEHLLGAWTASCVTRVAVVVRPGDEELAALCRRFDVDVIVPPHAPAEMKDSVRLALEFLGDRYAPAPADVWLLAPADLPRLSAPIIDRVLAAHDPRNSRIVVPVHAGRRGHPVLFPWPLAANAALLGPDEGVNALLQAVTVLELPINDPAGNQDIDTPEDYEKLRRKWRQSCE